MTTTQCWTCEGSVRGRCGQLHRSRETASRHCERDMRDCRKQGGYSDRTPFPLNEAAKTALDRYRAAEDF